MWWPFTWEWMLNHFTIEQQWTLVESILLLWTQRQCRVDIGSDNDPPATPAHEFFIFLPRGGSLWSRQSLWIVWFSSGNCQIIYKEEWNRHRSEGIQWVQGDHPNLEPGSKCYCGKKHVRNLSPSWQAFSLETQLLRGWGQGTVGELFRLDNKLRTSTPARGRRINFLFKSY